MSILKKGPQVNPLWALGITCFLAGGLVGYFVRFYCEIYVQQKTAEEGLKAVDEQIRLHGGPGKAGMLGQPGKAPPGGGGSPSTKKGPGPAPNPTSTPRTPAKADPRSP